MAALFDLFFSWPAQCCGCREGPREQLQEARDKGQAPVPAPAPLLTAKSAHELQCKYSCIWAVMRLIPEMKFKEGTEFTAEVLGGKTGAAHKVTFDADPSYVWFVKVGRFLPQIRNHLREAGEKGIGPKLLAGDHDAIVQEFKPLSTFPVWAELLELPEEQRLAQAAKIGRLTAKMHTLTVPPGTAMEPLGKPNMADMPRMLMKFRAQSANLSVQLLKVLDYINRRPSTSGVGGEAGGPVFTHGDWRCLNILVEEDGTPLMCDVIAWKYCSRASDIATFLWLWDFHDLEDEDYKKGTGVYPPLPARRAMVEAYLSEAGFPSDREAVDEFLWEVEYESLRGVLYWIGIVGLRSDRFDWRRTIEFMEAVLSKASSGHTALRDSIVEFGLLSGAHERKFGEHFSEADNDARLRNAI